MFMLEKILRRIQSGLVGGVGHRLHSVIPGLSFEVMNCFQAIRLHSFKDKLCANACYKLLSKFRPGLWSCSSGVCNIEWEVHMIFL